MTMVRSEFHRHGLGRCAMAGAWLLMLLLVMGQSAATQPALAPPTTQPAQPATGNRMEVLVIHPKGGDELEVRPVGQTRIMKVQLIGIDAPAKATRETEGQEPWGTRAQQFLSLQVTRKIVTLEFDVQVKGEEGKVWAYLWLGDKLLNEEVLRAGHAVLATQVPNVKYVERLQAAQRFARENNAGIWNPKEPLTESPEQYRENHQTIAEENAAKIDALKLPRFQPGCVIGNRKSRKYHVPGGKHYEDAKESKHAIFFKSAKDAEAAGFTASVK